MPRRLPPLNALRAFEAAARHESFTRAADELNVSHAAISRHVRGLEQRLGVMFFKTVSRGVELTEDGEEYLSAISPAFDTIAEATDALYDWPEGLIYITCEPNFAVKWLMPRLGEFQDEFESIEVSIDASGDVADLKRHEFDLAIRYGAGNWDGLEADLVSKSEVYPVGSPRLLKKAGEIRSPLDLCKLKLLHEDEDGWLWKHWFAAAGVPDVHLPPFPGPLSTALAIEAAAAGQGVALLSDDLAERDLSDGRLVKFSAFGMSFGAYYLVYLKSTLRQKAVATFRSWLLRRSEEFRQAV